MCVYAYNTSKHESTKHTPFEVMFGRAGVLPVDFISARECEDELSVQETVNDEVVDHFDENRRTRLEIVKKIYLLHRKHRKSSTISNIPIRNYLNWAHSF